MISTGAIESITGSTVRQMTPLSGGDVAQSFRVELTDGMSVFAKTHPDPPVGFFTTEAWGLEWLRSACGLEPAAMLVPRVIGHGDDPPILVLEWIDESPAAETDEAAFGAALAKLHQTSAPCFGRQDRRTTGSRGLPNEPCNTWTEFYASQRLLPLSRLAADGAVLSEQAIRGLARIADSLAEIGGPPEPPARLHGDLWAGNRIIDRAGRSWLIDPACHGGHREFDLAMMRLFGGFSENCHASYQEVSPLADGWQERVRLHQLAPLLVHAIKFGGGYVGAASDAIAAYQ
ncbi:MAG: fructosamine kinase family protein [Acidimicrobiales bacterium]